MGKRFAIVIGVAAAGVMAVPAASAGGHKYATKLTITRDGNQWHGGVQSKAGRGAERGPIECERHRRVILFRQRPGADRRLGASFSRHHLGPWFAWRVRAPVDGRVYAKVKREVLDDGDVCRRDRSEIIVNGDV